MAFIKRSSRFTTLRSFTPPRVGTSSSSSSRLPESSSVTDFSSSSLSRISPLPRQRDNLCCSYADYVRIKAMGRAPAPPPPSPPPQRPMYHIATPWDPAPEFSDLSWHTISSSETYQTRSIVAPLRKPVISAVARSPEAPKLSRYAVQRMALDEKRVQAVCSRNRRIDEIMREEPDYESPRRWVKAAATPRFSPLKRVRSQCNCPPTGQPFWRANCKKCNPPTQKATSRPTLIPTPPEPRLVSSAVIPTTIKTGPSWRQRISDWLDDCDTPSEVDDSSLTSLSGSFFTYVGEVIATGLRTWNQTWTSVWS